MCSSDLEEAMQVSDEDRKVMQNPEYDEKEAREEFFRGDLQDYFVKIGVASHSDFSNVEIMKRHPILKLFTMNLSEEARYHLGELVFDAYNPEHLRRNETHPVATKLVKEMRWKKEIEIIDGKYVKKSNYDKLVWTIDAMDTLSRRTEYRSADKIFVYSLMKLDRKPSTKEIDTLAAMVRCAPSDEFISENRVALLDGIDVKDGNLDPTNALRIVHNANPEAVAWDVPDWTLDRYIDKGAYGPAWEAYQDEEEKRVGLIRVVKIFDLSPDAMDDISKLHPGKDISDAIREVLTQEKMRSEERHVGKECRSRWSPYH